MRRRTTVQEDYGIEDDGMERGRETVSQRRKCRQKVSFRKHTQTAELEQEQQQHRQQWWSAAQEPLGCFDSRIELLMLGALVAQPEFGVDGRRR